MVIYSFCSLCVILLGATNVRASFVRSGNVETESRYCVCVPYWQCKEDYSGLVEDGKGIIDVRLQPRNSCRGDFDVCCQIECGKRKTPALKRISAYGSLFGWPVLENYHEAGFAEFPWMLGILEDNNFRCGASLIHPQVALTAAHCISRNKQVNVRAGEWDWMEETEPFHHQDRLVEKVIFHPSYHPPSLSNDIALLVLGTPFKLTESVGLACLPPQDNQLLPKKCMATGWGKNSFVSPYYQPILKKIELPLVSHRECQEALQNFRLGRSFRLHKSFICAGGEADRDTCIGDGGSPLVCPIDDQLRRYQQVGIVSWGLTCGVYDTPGVYVNVGLFRDWIDTTMRLLDFDTTIYAY